MFVSVGLNIAEDAKTLLKEENSPVEGMTNSTPCFDLECFLSADTRGGFILTKLRSPDALIKDCREFLGFVLNLQSLAHVDSYKCAGVVCAHLWGCSCSRTGPALWDQAKEGPSQLCPGMDTEPQPLPTSPREVQPPLPTVHITEIYG